MSKIKINEIEVEGVVYDIGGEDVIPNPEDEATEQLKKLQVADTVYSIPSKTSELENDANFATEEYVDEFGGKIDSISIDGTPQTIDANKNVDLPAYPTRQSLDINNVDNTSDLDKPVSTATQNALDLKEDKANKVTSWSLTPTDEHYPCEKLVKDSLDAKSDTSSTVTNVQYDTTNKKITKTIGSNTSDVVAASKLKEDMELNNVVNTGDSASPTENGTTKFTTGGAYTLKQSVDSKVSGVGYSDSNITETINGTTTNVVSASTLKTDMNLNNVTNDAQVKGLSSGTTENHIVTFGTDGYTVKDSGKSISDKQDTIDSSHKLDADLVDDSSSTHKFATSAQLTQIGTNQTDIANINAKIPEQASSSNQLADKEFVNSSISTTTATFRGTYNLVNDLHLSISATESQIDTALNTIVTTKTKNDYAYVEVPTSDATPTEIAQVDRYKYGDNSFEFEYTLNNSGFTAEQWAAINSGATSTNIGKITTNETAINNIKDGTTIDSFADVETALSGKQSTLDTQTAYTSKGSATKVPQITTNSLGQVTDITEVTITQPTVNNPTITIQKNSTDVDSFTLNQSSNKSINITVPTALSELSSDSTHTTVTEAEQTQITTNATAISNIKDGQTLDSFGDVETALSGKEDTSNKVPSTTGLSASSTDVEYPSAKTVYEAIQGVPQGTVTSVNAEGATNSHISVSGGPVTSSGTLSIGIESGYSIPSDSKQNSWDTKFSEIGYVELTSGTGQGIVTAEQLAEMQKPYCVIRYNDTEIYYKVATTSNSIIFTGYNTTKDGHNQYFNNTITVSTGLLHTFRKTSFMIPMYTFEETNLLLAAKQNEQDKVTSLSIQSTNVQYPGAKCVYDVTNKSLYNLGAYDIYPYNHSSNILLRQTGYVNGKDLMGNGIYTNAAGNPYIGTTINVNSVDNIVGNCDKVGAENWWNVTFSQVTVTYDSNSNTMIIMLPYGATDTSALQGIEIQYKLTTPYTEQVIENQPLITLDQKGSEWLRNEWEKGLNLLPNSSNLSGANTTITFKVNIESGKTYTFFLSGGTGSGNYSLWTTQNGTLVQEISASTSYLDSITFTATGNANEINIYPNNISNMNAMLTESDHAYPYQAYEGAIVHEKDLDDDLSNYLPTTGGTLYNGSNDHPLVLRSNSSSCYLGFKDSSSNDLGYIGVNANSQPIIWTATTGDKRIIVETDLASYVQGSPASPRDFNYGTRIITDLDYSQTSGSAFYMEIKGDAYNDGSCFSIVQGYMWDNTIINNTITNLGMLKISGLVAINVDGYLNFWFPRQGYWESFSVVVNVSNLGDYKTNHVISITDSAKPSGTKEVSFGAYGYLPISGGTLNGNLTMYGNETTTGYIQLNGENIKLAPPSSNSNESGDILFLYGNGAEKMRIWADTTYSNPVAPNYRVYDTGGNQLYSGKLATAQQLQKYDGTCYYNLGTYYNAGQTASYVRIRIPDMGTNWVMAQLEISIRQSYSDGWGGKLIINGYSWNDEAYWHSLNGYGWGNMSRSTIKVYGSGKDYIYIEGIQNYGGLSVDRLLLGDSITGADLTNQVEVDGVSSLPSGYVTATMRFGADLGDLGAYLSLSGGTMTGAINMQNSINTQINGDAIILRPDNGDYYSGINYRTQGNEAVCFENKSSVTSWIFRNYDPTVSNDAYYTNVTPSMQIKNQRVTINKLIPDGSNADYNLDVNGTANATTLYENGTALSSLYLPLTGGSVTGATNIMSMSFSRGDEIDRTSSGDLWIGSRVATRVGIGYSAASHTCNFEVYGKTTLGNPNSNEVLDLVSNDSSGYVNINFLSNQTVTRWTMGRSGNTGNFYIGYYNGSSWNDNQFVLSQTSGIAYLNGNQIATTSDIKHIYRHNIYLRFSDIVIYTHFYSSSASAISKSTFAQNIVYNDDYYPRGIWSTGFYIDDEEDTSSINSNYTGWIYVDSDSQLGLLRPNGTITGINNFSFEDSVVEV